MLNGLKNEAKVPTPSAVPTPKLPAKTETEAVLYEMIGGGGGGAGGGAHAETTVPGAAPAHPKPVG
jgi:hypothetical protein